MYAKCDDIANARKLFDYLHMCHLVSFSAMISAYANHGDSEEALNLFSLKKMKG
jgi:pentatricopeptide repeat protein